MRELIAWIVAIAAACLIATLWIPGLIDFARRLFWLSLLVICIGVALSLAYAGFTQEDETAIIMALLLFLLAWFAIVPKIRRS